MRRLAGLLLLLASPAAGETLLIEGSALRQSLDCTGRDVLVRGHRNALVLTGGCRSLHVQGDVSSIRAELEPGARVTLAGEVLDLTWSLSAAGAPPRIAEQGRQISIARVMPR
ncbi:hypothetical protein [Falsiroseomonas sp. E2-1-a20]|uniref:hypothetical protein n=1 Tax=Falsiroseomonas sp. E2-1-a20 TaxID=3239300 RepID=UPI003F327680